MSVPHYAPSMPRITNFRSSSLEESCNHVAHSLTRHRMEARCVRDVATRLYAVEWGELEIVDISYGTDVQIEAEALSSHFMVHLALAGRTRLRRGGKRQLEGMIDQDTVQITCPGDRSRFDLTGECRHLTLRLPEASLENYLVGMQIPINRPLQFECDGGGHIAHFWRDTLTHLVSQLTSRSEIPVSDRLRQHYLAMIAEILLTNYRSNYSSQVNLYGNTVMPWHVKRARDIIHNSTDEHISIPSLAAQVGVSARSLQNGFRDFLGITPVEYIRRYRLERLHAALLNAEPHESVTEIMLDCGIVNFGRYASYYRGQYGCRPSDTLRLKQSVIAR